MNILCISGKARHGKDLSATILRDELERQGKRVVIIHYADLLKYICRQFFGWDGQKDDHGRDLLQQIGTDIVRKQDPDFWVRFVKNILHLFRDKWDYAIIPDTRFPNEIEVLKDDPGNDVKHIHILRRGFESSLSEEQKQHLSETALDNVVPDFFVDNREGIPELKNRLHEILQQIQEGQW